MSKLVPQKSISVEVEYYDATEKQKLQKYRSKDSIEKLCGGKLDIPTEQFLTYYLFRKKRLGVPGFRTYGEVRKKIGQALADLDGFVRWDGSSISQNPDADHLETYMSEGIGEAVALSVMNQIHNMMLADWQKIPESNRPTLDYQFGSNGQTLIQVEAKGTCQSDNSVKGGDGSVRNHAARIRTKKRKNQQSLSHASKFGVITSISKQSLTQPLRAYLLDPPADLPLIAPSNARLISRMSFISNLISYVFPRSQFTSALASRVEDLKTIQDPWELDGVALFRRSGEPFTEPPSYMTKSRSADLQSIGHLIGINSEDALFLGFDPRLLELAIRQDFGQVMEYVFQAHSKEQSVACVMTPTRFGQLGISKEITPKESDAPYVRFELYGQVSNSIEGISFGRLPLSSFGIPESSE